MTATDRRPWTRRRCLVAVLVVALGLAGCASDGGIDRLNRTGAPPPAGPEPDDVAPPTVSVAVAGAMEEAAANDGLVRWVRDTVTVAVSGQPTPRDLEVLDATIDELRATTALDLRRSVDADPSITVLFAPRAQWPTEPEEAGHVLGVTHATWEGDGHLRHADVAVDSTIGQAARNQTIVHEMVHALGLGHVTCVSSVIYGGPDGAPTWDLSPLDQSLVTTWYDPALPTGAPAAEVGALLDVQPGGPACEPQAVEAAETDDGTIWCEVTTGSQPCVLVDGLGPEPTVPLDADRWAVDGVVYDHDPERYGAFSFEGRRLLCELAGRERRPCQFTDGPGPLTGVDAWTDGELVYDEP
jgi:hypothetical protein